MEFTCIDAFAGAGGLSLGLRRAGFSVVLAFDNDPVCVETQRLNRKYLPHPIVEADVEDLLGGRLGELAGIKRGELFLLAGGPPCQGFSIQRIGPDHDERNSLVAIFMRLAGETRPQYFLMENVAGLTGRRGKRFLQEALELGMEAGYWVHSAVLDAQDYGVPQRRRRLFVVGERQDSPLSAFSFPAPTCTKKDKRTVRQVIGHLPPPPNGGEDHPEYPLHRRDRLSDLNKRRLDALKAGQGREHLPRELLAECHKRDASQIGHRNVYGRMAWDDVAPTITARFDSFTRGKFGHPDQLRSISLREGAMLQTFPDDFAFFGNKIEIARQIGNAVPPQLAEVLGRQIIRSSKLHRRLVRRK